MPDTPPLVSVVVPAFESAQYLNEALQSVLHQTFTDYEILVVDDGSSNRTVEQYRLPPRSRLIRLETPHGSGAAARNVGIGLARGTYVALLDQDDVWLPRKLETQVALLSGRPAAAMASCHPTFVDASLRPLSHQPPRVQPQRDLLHQLLLSRIGVPPSAVLLRRRLLEDGGTFDENVVASDTDLWLRLVSRHEALFDPTSHVLYRHHTHQLSHDRIRACHNYLALLDKTARWMGTVRPDVQAALPRYRGRVLRHLARLQMLDQGDVELSLRTLRAAFRAYPWSPKLWLLAGVAACLLLRRRQRHA